VDGRIRSIEKIHLIGTRTRDLPACSIVPQPSTLPRVPSLIQYICKFFALQKSVVLNIFVLEISYLNFGFINIVFQGKRNSSSVCLLHNIFVEVFGVGLVSSCNLIYTHSIDHVNCCCFCWNTCTEKGNKIFHTYIAYHFSDKNF
jgi:hypothetical protein